MNNQAIDSYFSGEKIFGDDFDLLKIEEWFKQEENGYAELGYVDSKTDFYPYHGINWDYGWKYLDGAFTAALGLGSAFAAEFETIASRIDQITVIEPSKKFWRASAFGKNLNYVMPKSTGKSALTMVNLIWSLSAACCTIFRMFPMFFLNSFGF